MKKIKYIIITALLLYVVSIGGFSQTLADNGGIFGNYTNGNLTIVSYSQKWSGDMLEKLYDELRMNFHGNEFDCLEKIIIHNDSPYGVNGLYHDDIFMGSNGKYNYGNKAYIELFNGERYDTVEKMAPILSHEYGHHYTICNITLKENKYYSEWQNSEYGKIRNLSEYPVVFSSGKSDYAYIWDISEIAAEDYVQLLGSKNAKKSFDYKDYYEKLSVGEDAYSTAYDSFNLNPQDNLDISFAAQVDGLYSYMLGISGYTAGIYMPEKLPAVTNVKKNENGIFNIYWSKAEGSSPFEYTAVFYSKGNSKSVFPIKTVSDGEALEGGFIPFDEECVIRIFVKDSKGFIYSSEPLEINFSDFEVVM